MTNKVTTRNAKGINIGNPKMPMRPMTLELNNPIRESGTVINVVESVRNLSSFENNKLLEQNIPVQKIQNNKYQPPLPFSPVTNAAR